MYVQVHNSKQAAHGEHQPTRTARQPLCSLQIVTLNCSQDSCLTPRPEKVSLRRGIGAAPRGGGSMSLFLTHPCRFRCKQPPVRRAASLERQRGLSCHHGHARGPTRGPTPGGTRRCSESKAGVPNTSVLLHRLGPNQATNLHAKLRDKPEFNCRMCFSHM